tara:strand:+ start:298 stop:930 length:633 start_codon:yes stop_codon:yes gene_type:complete
MADFEPIEIPMENRGGHLCTVCTRNDIPLGDEVADFQAKHEMDTRHLIFGTYGFGIDDRDPKLLDMTDDQYSEHSRFPISRPYICGAECLKKLDRIIESEGSKEFSVDTLHRDDGLDGLGRALGVSIDVDLRYNENTLLPNDLYTVMVRCGDTSIELSAADVRHDNWDAFDLLPLPSGGDLRQAVAENVLIETMMRDAIGSEIYRNKFHI